MIRFACPGCQNVYDVPDDVAGRKTNCRQCGQRLQVPALPNKTVMAPLVGHSPDAGSNQPARPLAVPVTVPQSDNRYVEQSEANQSALQMNAGDKALINRPGYEFAIASLCLSVGFYIYLALALGGLFREFPEVIVWVVEVIILVPIGATGFAICGWIQSDKEKNLVPLSIAAFILSLPGLLIVISLLLFAATKL